jgi:hypothetical protein
MFEKAKARFDRVKTKAAGAMLGILVTTQDAVAQITPSGCATPEAFQPLFEMLDAIAQVAFVGGIGVATIGLLVAGIYIAMPGEDNTRRGKSVTKSAVFGAVLLLSANMIVAFLTGQLGMVFC